MRKFVLLIFLILLIQNSWAYENVIYLSDRSKYQAADADKALAKTLKGNRNTPILVLVHGRGKQPAKGFALMPKIEKRYGVKIIMFHWSSWISRYTRPAANAYEAGADLYTALKMINRYKKNNQQSFKKIKISLMSHSMGAIVIESMLKKYKSNEFEQDLFSNTIINQADTMLKGHDKSLERLDFQNNLFITSNSGDFALMASEVMEPGTRLGTGIFLNDESGISVVPLLEQATYINLSKVVERRHRTYMLNYENMKYRDAIYFYNQIIQSELPGLNGANNIYKLKVQSNPYNNVYEFRL